MNGWIGTRREMLYALRTFGAEQDGEWKETVGKVIEAAFCEHKEMVATGYADLAWRCAKCGYVYGTL